MPTELWLIFNANPLSESSSPCREVGHAIKFGGFLQIVIMSNQCRNAAEQCNSRGAPKRSLLSNPNLCVSLLPHLQVPEGRLRLPHTQEWPCSPITQTHYSLDNRQLTCVTQHKQHMHTCCHKPMLHWHSEKCFQREILDVQEVLVWNKESEMKEQVDSINRQRKKDRKSNRNRAKPEETHQKMAEVCPLRNKNIYLNHHEMEKICIINVCMYKRWKVTGELHLAIVCRVFIVVQAVLSSCQHFALPKALGLHRSWWLSVRKRGNLNTQTGNWGIIKCILDVNLSPQSSR